MYARLDSHAQGPVAVAAPAGKRGVLEKTTGGEEAGLQNGIGFCQAWQARMDLSGHPNGFNACVGYPAVDGHGRILNVASLWSLPVHQLRAAIPPLTSSCRSFPITCTDCNCNVPGDDGSPGDDLQAVRAADGSFRDALFDDVCEVDPSVTPPLPRP